MNGKQRDPGKANNERQSLKYSGEICETWHLAKTHARQNKNANIAMPLRTE
jgi:predicted MarR family transcription regulator